MAGWNVVDEALFMLFEHCSAVAETLLCDQHPSSYQYTAQHISVRAAVGKTNSGPARHKTASQHLFCIGTMALCPVPAIPSEGEHQLHDQLHDQLHLSAGTRCNKRRRLETTWLLYTWLLESWGLATYICSRFSGSLALLPQAYWSVRQRLLLLHWRWNHLSHVRGHRITLFSDWVMGLCPGRPVLKCHKAMGAIQVTIWYRYAF